MLSQLIRDVETGIARSISSIPVLRIDPALNGWLPGTPIDGAIFFGTLSFFLFLFLLFLRVVPFIPISELKELRRKLVEADFRNAERARDREKVEVAGV